MAKEFTVGNEGADVKKQQDLISVIIPVYNIKGEMCRFCFGTDMEKSGGIAGG